MITFSKLTLVDGKPVETDVREISLASIKACPHYIMMADHYLPDGSCRCNDPTHTEMAEWGYEWDGKVWQSPEEDEE